MTNQDVKPEEAFVEQDNDSESSDVRFTFPTALDLEVIYKVNVFSVISLPQSQDTFESRELHGKVVAKENGLSIVELEN